MAGLVAECVRARFQLTGHRLRSVNSPQPFSFLLALRAKRLPGGYLFDLSTVVESELFDTDKEKHSAQGDWCRALLPQPPSSEAPVPVAYAFEFKEPQPVAMGWGHSRFATPNNKRAAQS